MMSKFNQDAYDADCAAAWRVFNDEIFRLTEQRRSQTTRVFDAAHYARREDELAYERDTRLAKAHEASRRA